MKPRRRARSRMSPGSGLAAPLARWQLRKGSLALALLGLLEGCAPPARPAPPAQPASVAEVPSGAIAVGADLYQVPIGEDADGCPMYRLYSPTRLVSQAIAYPKRGGGFTHDRREADCAG